MRSTTSLLNARLGDWGVSRVGLIGRLLCLIVCLLSITSVQARNEFQPFSINEAVAAPGAAAQLDSTVKLYFGGQSATNVAKTLRDILVVRRVNTVLNKGDAACRSAFVEAIGFLQKAARAAGGNAVINIRSNFKNNERSSEVDYDCSVGSFRSVVSLKGTTAVLGR